MPTFTGTANGDTITPENVSTGVTAVGAATPGAGVDTVTGGGGNDTLDGGSGADSITAGGGNDLIHWQFRSFDSSGPLTTVAGGAGTDTFQVDHIDDSEGGWAFNLNPAATSGHAALSMFQSEAVFGGSFVFNAANFDLTGVENVVLTGTNSDGTAPSGLGISDSFIIGDLKGTGIKSLSIDLGQTPGFPTVPDRASDFVTLTGTSGADHVTVTGPGSGVEFTISGLAATVNLHHFGPTDGLTISAGAGNDTIDLSQIDFGLSNRVINGDAGNDTITDAYQGVSVGFNNAHLNGGDGNDRLIGGEATAVIYGGNGNDTLTSGGVEGTTFAFDDGDSGSDVITNFHSHQAFGASADTVAIGRDLDFSFADLVNHGHIFQSGANVVITDGNHIIVTLQNIQLSTLNSSDIVL